MDDDIDIEEHDLLDHPHIRTIFPDLTRIKTEIPDADFEVEDNFDHTSYSNAEDSSTPIHNPDEEYTRYKNKIILGSKPSTNSEPTHTSLVFGHNIEVKTEILDEVELHEEVKNVGHELGAYGQSVIVLGNKQGELSDGESKEVVSSIKTRLQFEDADLDLENDDEEEEEEEIKYVIQDSFVVLEDWGPMLRSNPSYCSQCEILFPTPNTLQAHNMVAHSFLVAVESNKAMKSTAKKTIQQGKYCNHCNKTFPDSDSLINHLYQSLTFDKHRGSFVTQPTANKNVAKTPFQTKTDKPLKKVTDIKPVFINDKSTVATSQFAPSAVTTKSSVDNQVATTSKDERSNARFYRCIVCSMFFVNRKSYFSHSLQRHGLEDLDETLVEYDPKCAFCKTNLGPDHSRHYNKHISRSHSDMYTEQGDTAFDKDPEVLNIEPSPQILKEKDEVTNVHPNVTKPVLKIFNSSERRVIPNIVDQDSDAEEDSAEIFVPDIINNRERPAKIQNKTNGTKMYLCKKCNAVCAVLETAQQHLTRFHPEMKNAFNKLFALCNYSPRDIIERPKKIGHIKKKFNGRYQCMACTKIFKNTYAASVHKKLVHPDKKNKMMFKKLETKVKPVVATKISKVSKVDEATDEDISNVEEGEGVFIDKRYPFIPKSTLFLCQTCQVHFTSFTATALHPDSCLELDFKICGVCERKISPDETVLHQMQHHCGNSFKTYSFLGKSLYGRVWNECPDCFRYFSDKNFWRHVPQCGKGNAKMCSHCNIPINESCYPSHQLWHESSKSSGLPPILIKYQKSVRNTSKPLKRKIESEDESPAKKQKRNMKLCMYYCEKCKTFSKIINQYHITGKCTRSANFVKKRAICQSCGLITNAESHKVFHQEHPKITIHDMTFVSLKNIKQPIPPPIPEYRKCKKCQTYFCKWRSVMVHSCLDQHKTCKYCNKKFSDLAYKLHVKFHEYAVGNSERGVDENSRDSDVLEGTTATEDLKVLLEKYETLSNTWNILYLCQTCNTHCDDYDKAVEHAQNHFINTENLNVTIVNCKICNLNFDSASYHLHKELHDQNSEIKASTFQILPYDYSKLLTDKWMKMFSKLKQSQMQQILSKSLYSRFRGVRMKVLKPGPTQYVLYKCVKCNAFCSPQHAPKVCKKSSPKFPCVTCLRPFISAQSRAEHQKMHRKTKDVYKIVQINAYGDEKLNGKLWQEHVKQCRKARLRANVAEKRLVNIYDKDTIFYFYECLKCKACLFSRKTARKHVCHAVECCPICKKFFSRKYLPKHKTFHRSPHFNSKNMQIIPFKPKTDKTSFVIESRTITLYKCVCGLHFTTQAASEKHVEICGENPKISKEKCSKCDRLFDTSQLFVHLCNHHGKSMKDTKYKICHVSPRQFKIYKCRYCEILFVSQQTLKAHNCYFTKDVPACKKCGLRFSDSAEHSEVHANCERYSYSDYNISTVCPKNKIFKCSDCGICFVDYVTVRSHLRNKALLGCRGLLLAVACTICGLKFQRHAYNMHLRTHRPGRLHRVEYMNVIALSVEDGKTVCRPERNTMQIDVRNKVLKTYSKKTMKSVEEEDVTIEKTKEGEEGKGEKYQVSKNTELEKHKTLKDYKISVDSSVESDVVLSVGVTEGAKENKFSLRNILLKCDMCDVCFSFKNGFHTHINNCHLKGSDVLPSVSECNLCHHRVVDSTLSSHDNQHHSEGQLREDLFVLPLVLRNDILISKYVFQCKQCLATFGHNYENFSKHIKEIIHPVKACKYCGFVYPKRGNTQVHVKYCREMMKEWKREEIVILQQTDETHFTVVREELKGVKWNSYEEDEELESKDGKVHLQDGSENVVNSDPNADEIDSEKVIVDSDTRDKKLTDENLALQFDSTEDKNKDLRTVDEKTELLDDFEGMLVDSDARDDELKLKEQEKELKDNSIEAKIDSIANNMEQRVNKNSKTNDNVANCLDSQGTKSNDGDDIDVILNKTAVENSTEITESTVRDDKTNGDDVKPSTSNSTDEVYQIKEADSSGASASANDDANTPTISAKDMIRLYKCSACNVTFITPVTCKKHVTKHTPFNAIDYIECKLCGFQFPIVNTLQCHIAKHHKTEFKLENVIIEEHNPNILCNGRPKVDVYCASDKVQSKLVSTTTEKDNLVSDSSVSRTSLNVDD